MLRISSSTRTTDGGYVTAAGVISDLGLPPLTIGGSSDALSGDAVSVAGFPDAAEITSNENGMLQLPGSNAVGGSVDSFQTWPGCESAAWQDALPLTSVGEANCSQDGNVSQALVSLTMPNGSPGPGSPVVHNGTVIGVVLGEDDQDSSTIHALTSASFRGWLDEVIDANS